MSIAGSGFFILIAAFAGSWSVNPIVFRLFDAEMRRCAAKLVNDDQRMETSAEDEYKLIKKHFDMESAPLIWKGRARHLRIRDYVWRSVRSHQRLARIESICRMGRRDTAA